MEIKRDVPMAQISHYKIGGPASYFCEAMDAEEIAEGLKFFNDNFGSDTKKLFIMGAGTNVLFADEGFNGLVMKIAPDYIVLEEGDILRAGAGTKFEDIVQFAIENGLEGFEWAGGLPGLLGGAVRGNAGAFGGETKDNLIEAKSIKISEPDNIIMRNNAECRFGYRTSIFKENADEIIIETSFALKAGNREKLALDAASHAEYRIKNQPLDYPSAGSTFKNVPLEAIPDKGYDFSAVIKKDPFAVVPVAYLLSEAGMKGTRIGGAEMSFKHPNFIINVGEAKSEDVISIIKLAKEKVFEKFGVKIEEEIQIVKN